MREVEFIYLEVMNETEQVLVFQTMFNGKPYAVPIILNTALPVAAQDSILAHAITALANINRKSAAESINPEEQLNENP